MICREMGSAVSISEFINCIDVVNGHPYLNTKIAFSEDERPFGYQVFDDDPDRMLKAVLILVKNNPDFIDINIGCSAKNVTNRGAGSALLKDPIKIGQMASNLVTALKIPVTAKIRLGWDACSRNYLEVAKILEDSGISMLSVHARTRKQEFSGAVDWPAIGEVKSLIHIPVIGNGDVKNESDAERLLQTTGCDAVMIGRAALGNPWIFGSDPEAKKDPDVLFAMIKRHLESVVAHYTPKFGILIFRKHLNRYLSQYLISSDIRREIFTIADKEQLLNTISKLMQLTSN
jgi:nifR3 family TIM-barrel protein